MELSTYIATSRLLAQTEALDAIANNLANANTPGFKQSHIQFSDWLWRERGAATPPGGGSIAYTQVRGLPLDFAQGPIEQTGNPLDLALKGRGFFTVQTPRGIRLTRAGRFGLMPDGTIADSSGDPLLDAAGQPIRINPTTDTGLTVASDGTLSSRNGVLGQIAVVQPQSLQSLVAQGGHLYRATGPTTPVSQPRIVQGALEQSNVQPILELTRMLQQSRQFHFMTQFVQAEDSRRQAAIDKIATPTA